MQHRRPARLLCLVMALAMVAGSAAIIIMALAGI